MNYDRHNNPDPSLCWLCWNPLVDPNYPISHSDKRVHQGCLDQMLYDEWMAEKMSEEFEREREMEEVTE